jgi:hypothetical protein
VFKRPSYRFITINWMSWDVLQRGGAARATKGGLSIGSSLKSDVLCGFILAISLGVLKLASREHPTGPSGAVVSLVTRINGLLSLRDDKATLSELGSSLHDRGQQVTSFSSAAFVLGSIRLHLMAALLVTSLSLELCLLAPALMQV